MLYFLCSLRERLFSKKRKSNRCRLRQLYLVRFFVYIIIAFCNVFTKSESKDNSIEFQENTKMTKDEYLINEPPLKALTVFAMPMILGSFFQQVYNMADSIIVGQFVGSSALAAVGACAALTRQPLFRCSKLRQDENNSFYFVNQFFGFKHNSRCFGFLQFSLDDEHIANACRYNEKCGAVFAYLFCRLSVFIYV